MRLLVLAVSLRGSPTSLTDPRRRTGAYVVYLRKLYEVIGPAGIDGRGLLVEDCETPCGRPGGLRQLTAYQMAGVRLVREAPELVADIAAA